MTQLVPYHPAALTPRRQTPPVRSGAGGVPVMWAASRFHGPVRGMIAPPGSSIAEIVARALLIDPELTDDFLLDGVVTINGQEVPRRLWARLRVHRRDGARVIVVLHPGLGKGGGNVLATIIQIAAIVAAIALTGPFGVAAALGLTAFQAGVLALGITVGASLAANALSAPPTLPQLGAPGAISAGPGVGRAGVSGNVLAPNAPIPRMTGKRRYAPPFGCYPYAYIDGNDEVIEALYVYAHPTAHTAPKFGGVALEDMPDIEVQTSEGKPGDPPLTLINRITATEAVNITLSRHKVADDGIALENQKQPERSLPIFHPVVGKHDADEIVLVLECAAGLLDLNAPAAPMAVPARIEFKLEADKGWTNGPEIHFASSNGQPFRKQIKLIWETPPLFISQAPTMDAPTLAFKLVPGQTINPPRPGWQADDYFSAGAGGDLMSASTFNAHNVRNISLEKDAAILHLDPAVFPKGRYLVRLSFGAAYAMNSFTPATYLYGEAVYDLFGYYVSAGIYKTPVTRALLRDELMLTRCSTIQYKNPLPKPEGIAFTAIRVRNRQLGEFTELAAGLVPDWDGLEWSGLIETRNPAPHYRARLASIFPAELIGDDAILDWRSFNIAEGYETCAALLDGSFLDGLTLMGSAGRARPRQDGRKWDVLVDRDTSAEAPVQTFSQRNVRDFGVSAPMAEQSGGLYVRFADSTLDWKENFTIVRNPNASDPSLPLEEMVNETHDDEAAVRARALFDILQHEERANEYPFEVPALGLRAQSGDLIVVQHYILMSFAGAARVKQILMTGGDVTGLILDGAVPTPIDQAFSNIAAAWSNYALAFAASRLGAAIRLTDGSEQKAEIVPVGGDSTQITFVTPFALPAGLQEGCHVVTGPLGEENRRMKIKRINPTGNLKFAIVAVDEANEIHQGIP